MHRSQRFQRLAAIVAISLSPVWAETGLPNFHKVDDHLYRGAQPSAEGFSALARMGVKTVVDLRGAEHSESKEKSIVESSGMRYVSIPMSGLRTPTSEQISRALKLMNNPSAGTVFIHCKRGADRTGAVVACYRIEHDHWANSNALEEARGFGMSWYQLAIQRYVMGYGTARHDAPIPALIAPASR